MVRCRLRSPSPQQGSGQQGESERLHQVQELRPEDVLIYAGGPTEALSRIGRRRRCIRQLQASLGPPERVTCQEAPRETTARSPSDAQALSLQGAHKILSKMSKSHLPNKA
uniref:Uncharacterized protein n=1 Tax=Balaenoptera musculus TaxID=9771 RepID=A0A8C0I6M4_BALMU